MEHLIIIAKVPRGGDILTGIASACKISKSSNVEINFHVESENIYHIIKPVSYDLDVFQIIRQEIELKNLKKK